MKRFAFILSIMLSCAIITAQGQIHVGIKGGLNISQMQLDKRLYKSSNRAGFFIGPTIEFGLPILPFSIDCSVLYDNYSVHMYKEDHELSEALQYVDIPVNFNLSFGAEHLLKFYLSTGPQMAINCGKIHVLEGNYSLDNTMLSWNLGAGVRILKHYHVSYTYNVGIGYTAELINRTTTTDEMSRRFYNPSHKIGFTYFF